jgi:hypothetical protein
MSIIFSTVNAYKFENLNDYFPKQHQPVGLSNEEAVFSKVEAGMVMLHKLISGLTGLTCSMQSLHLTHTAVPHKSDVLYFQ